MQGKIDSFVYLCLNKNEFGISMEKVVRHIAEVDITILMKLFEGVHHLLYMPK